MQSAALPVKHLLQFWIDMHEALDQAARHLSRRSTQQPGVVARVSFAPLHSPNFRIGCPAAIYVPAMVCSCGKCVAGILSPRMACRLQATAANAADMITDSIDWTGQSGRQPSAVWERLTLIAALGSSFQPAPPPSPATSARRPAGRCATRRKAVCCLPPPPAPLPPAPAARLHAAALCLAA